jgi:hypothetical protein
VFAVHHCSTGGERHVRELRIAEVFGTLDDHRLRIWFFRAEFYRGGGPLRLRKATARAVPNLRGVGPST